MMTARRPGMWTLWLLIVVALALPLIEAHSDGADKVRWTIIGYLSGEGDLGPAAERYLDRIGYGARVAGWNVAVLIDRLDNQGACAAARYLWRGGGEEAGSSEPAPGREAGINMGDPATLAGLLTWAREVAPAEHYALIVMGHGPPEDAPEPTVAARDAGSDGDGLTGGELAQAVAAAGGEANEPWLDALSVDCCYSGSLEVAYELRDVVGAFCGSPGLMPNPGVPWQDVLAEAAERGCADGRQLAEACLDVVAELPAAERPMLTAVLPPRLVEVGPCVTRLVTTATGSMAQAAPAITLAASESRACGGPQMCDAARFAARLAECADDATVRQAASEVALALKRSEVRPGIAGPTLLVPGPLGEIPAGYRQAATGIATECGWAELVEAYTSRLRDLMQPAALGGAAAPKGGV